MNRPAESIHPGSDRPGAHPEWRAWLALAWAVWFGILYVRMVLDERAPGVAREIGRLLGG